MRLLLRSSTLILVLLASLSQNSLQSAILPAPVIKFATSLPSGSCGTAKYLQYYATTNTLYGCSTTWQAIGSAGTSAAYTLTGLLDTVRSTTKNLTVANSCAAAPSSCQVRFGNTTYQIATSATATITTGSGTARIYIANGGALTLGYPGTIVMGTCTNITCTGSITAFPADSIPLYTWTASSDIWNASGSTDFRALISTKNVVAGAGLLGSESNGNTTLSLDVQIKGLSFIFDGGGSALSTGKTVYLRVPFACTLLSWSILSDTAETVTLKTWKIATGTAIPTVANTISTSGVSLSSGTAVTSSTLTDFTTSAIALNDIIAANITAVTAATFINFTLTIGCLP